MYRMLLVGGNEHIHEPEEHEWGIKGWMNATSHIHETMSKKYFPGGGGLDWCLRISEEDNYKLSGLQGTDLNLTTPNSCNERKRLQTGSCLLECELLYMYSIEISHQLIFTYSTWCTPLLVSVCHRHHLKITSSLLYHTFLSFLCLLRIPPFLSTSPFICYFTDQ